MEKANKVYIQRIFNCSRSNLFKWMVEPSLLCQWFGPKHLKVNEAEINLNVGGKYHIQLLKPDGKTFWIEGEYIEIDEPSKLAFSFKYHGLPNAAPDSIVSIQIEAIDTNISKLSLIQKFEITPADINKRTEAWEYMITTLHKKIAIIY